MHIGTRHVHVSWLYYRLSALGGFTKNATWKHIYAGHMEFTVLPRGMRIEEEGNPGACFNNYERQRSLKRFIHLEMKYH